MRKNYLWSMLAMMMVGLGGISLTACGDDDEETVVPILRGSFRTPYVYEVPQWSEASAGLLHTGHSYTCKSIHMYSFNDDLNVYSERIHSNSCVKEHKWLGEGTWVPILDANKDTLDWSINREESSILTYKLDTKQHTVTISDGNTYFLELDSTGRFYKSMKNKEGVTVYVLGLVQDEEYNNENYFHWLSEEYNNK